MIERKTIVAAVVGVAVVLTCMVLLAGRGFLARPSAWAETIRPSARPKVLYNDPSLSLAGATAISASVTGSWVTDSIPGQYRYTYTLNNNPSSPNTITEFALAPVPRPVGATTPPHWSYFYGDEVRDDVADFSVTDNPSSPPADWDSVNIYPSPYDLQPGDSATFVLVSTASPTMIRYYVQGFRTYPTDAESEGPDPPSLYDDSVTGSVVGPNPVTGVGQRQPTPPGTVPKLSAPTPNPSIRGAAIAFYLPSSARVSLGVYDASGRLVRSLADRSFTGGVHSVSWDGLTAGGKKASSGVYFFRLRVNGADVGGRKMVVVR